MFRIEDVIEPRLVLVDVFPLSMKSSASLAIEASLWQHMPFLYLLHNQPKPRLMVQTKMNDKKVKSILVKRAWTSRRSQILY
jgi:hypothetical protein